MANVKMIAHRGSPRYELENTKESFIAAGNRSYYGIETDVTLIKDGSIILYHDDDLNRLAGVDQKTREMTLEEINNVVLNERPNYHTYEYKIATLKEYLAICAHYNKYPVIDVKWGFTNEAIDKLIKLIKEVGLYNDSMIICYTMSTCLYIKKKYSDYHIQFLAGMLFNEENVQICLENGLDLDVEYHHVTKELVDRFHDKGLKVNCWTVDNYDDYCRLVACGVDYITSNILE